VFWGTDTEGEAIRNKERVPLRTRSDSGNPKNTLPKGKKELLCREEPRGSYLHRSGGGDKSDKGIARGEKNQFILRKRQNHRLHEGLNPRKKNRKKHRTKTHINGRGQNLTLFKKGSKKGDGV